MIAPESPSLVPVDDRGARRPNDPLCASAESIKKATEWGIALAQQILATSRKQGPSSVAVNHRSPSRR